MDIGNYYLVSWDDITLSQLTHSSQLMNSLWQESQLTRASFLKGQKIKRLRAAGIEYVYSANMSYS